MVAVADNAFSALERHEGFVSLNIKLNLTAENDHEPYIEKFNRTIKEKCGMGIHGATFLRFPRRMIVESVYTQIFWYNFTIPKDYISNNIGPSSVMLGRI